MMCDDKELLIGYVYGELEEFQLAAVERHVATCAACREEAAELRGMRHHLASWTPPERELGFRIVRGPEAPAAPRPSRFRLSPAWGLAAAAVLVLAAATAIANLEVRYDANGLVVRAGWGAAPAAVEGTSGVAAAELHAEVERLNKRLEAFEAGAVRAPAAAENVDAPRVDDAEVIRQVRRMLNESEARQRREFVQVIAQVVRDFDMTRRADLARYQQGLGDLQGMTSAEVAQTRQLVNYLVRTASQK